MGQSDLVILAVSLLGFMFIGYFIFSLTKQKERGGGQAVNRDGADERGGGHQRQQGNLRRRRGGGEGGAVDENDEGNLDENDSDDEQDGGGEEPNLAGMTKKEIAKIEKRRAKAQQREAMEAEREERKEREEARMQLLRDREQEKEEEFLLREAERKQEEAALEKERQQAYNHWKDPYPDHVLNHPTAPSAGKTLPWDKSADEVALIKEKVMTYMKSSQIVSINELSMEVNVPTFNCISILKYWVKSGEICGAFVGEDQFVVIGENELEKLTSLTTHHGTITAKDVIDVLK